MVTEGIVPCSMAIADTDSLQSRGTGFLARSLAAYLERDGLARSRAGRLRLSTSDEQVPANEEDHLQWSTLC